MKGLEMPTPFGPIVWRALDHQSTMGAYVGQLSRKSSQGVMVNWRFAEGSRFLPPIEEVKALRKE
jgi:branched-chain amino acid transport system substrate-binding protein